MSKKKGFTPAAIEMLQKGSLLDPLTPGLRIELLASGKKKWKYHRRVIGGDEVVKATLGAFPAHTIADARKWADALNERVEAGVDPREEQRAANERAGMTVARAHAFYIQAAREGRASRAKRVNRPRTIVDKLKIFRCDIEPKLGKKSIYEITETDLLKLVNAKGKSAKVRANRLTGLRCDALLVIGVRAQPFTAHSWVQSGNFVLNDTPDEVARYTPIYFA